MKTSISFLKSKMSIEDTVKELEKTDTDYIHVDIMDGDFVENTTLSIEETKELLKDSSKPLDIHLMVSHPKYYIEELAKLNPSIITIHDEIRENKNELIDLIHSYGIKAGIAINPDTNVEDIETDLNKIDYVLIMGVYPGMGGQKLINDTIIKIDELAVLRAAKGLHYDISLDGGVNSETIDLLYGLDVVVSGSYVCLNDDYQSVINSIRLNIYGSDKSD